MVNVVVCYRARLWRSPCFPGAPGGASPLAVRCTWGAFLCRVSGTLLPSSFRIVNDLPQAWGLCPSCVRVDKRSTCGLWNGTPHPSSLLSPLLLFFFFPSTSPVFRNDLQHPPVSCARKWCSRPIVNRTKDRCSARCTNTGRPPQHPGPGLGREYMR